MSPTRSPASINFLSTPRERGLALRVALSFQSDFAGQALPLESLLARVVVTDEATVTSSSRAQCSAPFTAH